MNPSEMRTTLILCIVLFSCTRTEPAHLSEPSAFLSPVAERISNKSFDPSTLLWYTKPAEEWEEALPVGNGRLGAMVFGGVDEERIQLNEDSYWSGGPYSTVVEGGHKALPEIQKLIFEGKPIEAHKLFGRHLMGYPVEQQKYQSLANLHLFFEKEQEAPNILICITDDQSWVHTSFAGEKAITTPAFDRVAGEGLYFKNAFCAAPSCSPSRGSIITGQEMWRLGEAANLFSAVPHKLRQLSFPVLLEEHGYFTGYTQKGWAPNDFRIHGWEYPPLGFTYNHNDLKSPTAGIVSNNYAENFKDFLNKCPEDEPFLFWFGSSEPHRKFEARSGARLGVDPEKVTVPGFLPDVPEVRNDLADYLLEIQWVDQHLSSMIEELEARNLLNNTIIIVTSDNGMAFPSAKNNLYEYGIHMPLAIYWKDGIIEGGRVIEDLVSLTDLAPTLLECGGAKVPKEMTGNSLLKIFNASTSGRIEKSRKYVFAGKERHTVCREGELPYPQRSVRDYHYLYIRNLESDRWPAGSPDVPSVHGWLYGDIDQSPSLSYLLEHRSEPEIKPLFDLAVGKRPAEELYDIVKDPACLLNLADQKEYSSERKRLSGVLDKYLARTKDPRLVTGESIWDHFPYYFENFEGIVPYSDIKQTK